LNRKLRRAFLEGAEERSQRELGRGLTEEELQRVLLGSRGSRIERMEALMAAPGQGLWSPGARASTSRES